MTSILARRMATQGISQPRFRTPRDVVASLGCVQAQDYLGGLWAVGLRAAGATQETVERAISDRAIVRSWPMRGTLHFTAGADLRWILELCAPRVLRLAQKRLKNTFGIDAKLLAAARKTTIKALRDGKALRRDELYQWWEDHGIACDESRGLHLLFSLANEGLVCFGGRQGKQPTIVLLEEWLPQAKSLPRDESLGRLAGLYFSGHGPATLRDFVWWSGLTVKEAAQALELAQPLEQEVMDGHTFWWTGDPPEPARTSLSFLLPAWDEYTVGYRDRATLVHAAHAERVDPRYGVLNPALLNGQGLVFGSWKRTLTPHQAVVKPASYARLTKAEKKPLEQAVRRYGQFLGLPAVLAA